MYIIRVLFIFVTFIVLVGCSSDTAKSATEKSKTNISSKKLVTGFSNGQNGVEPFVIEHDGTLKELANINQTGASASPIFLGTVNDIAYYVTHKEDQLSALYKSDATAIGTEKVADFFLPEGSDVFGSSIVKDEVLYFTVSGDTEDVLWRTDGTSSGTYAIESFKFIRNLLLFNNKLYFSVRNENDSYAIYLSDGTAAGTEEYINTASEYVRAMVVFKEALYYARKQAIYKVDGILNSADLFFRIYELGTFYAGMEKLFFTPSNRQGVYVSDGTKTGTEKVSSILIDYGSYNNRLVIGDTFYFVGDTPAAGKELWKSDGTAAGTMMVKDLYVGAGGAYPREFANINGLLYFKMIDESNRRRLYLSDGSSSGTYKVSDYGGKSLVALGNKVFMIGDTPRADLYVIENNITTRLSQNKGTLTNFNAHSIRKVGEHILFVNEDITYGEELWVSDGTVAGTTLLLDLNKDDKDAIVYRDFVDVIADPQRFASINGNYYFTVTSSQANGNELWQSDGTVAGTYYLQTLNKKASTYPIGLVSGNGLLYYQGLTDSGDYALWRSDGTEGGTYILHANVPTKYKDIPRWLTPVGNKLFFVDDDGTHGRELFVSDGTEGGTYLLKDINIGSGTGGGIFLTEHNGTLFFVANDGVNGKCLYKSDGTEAGTIMVKDFYENSTTNPSFEYMTSSGNYLFFIAKSPSTVGRKLYRSDGTTEGTVVVKTIQTSPYYNTIHTLTDVDGTLYFEASGGLWKSDGSADGTVMITTIKGLNSPIAVGNMLFFIAEDSEHGRELWKSDGTAEGTSMVKDINPGAESSAILIRRGFEGNLIFSAFDGVTTNLYMSDGTQAGTKPFKK